MGHSGYGAPMSLHDLVIIIVFIGILAAMTPVLGTWLAKVLSGDSMGVLKPLGFVERLVYRAAGVNPSFDMNWKQYLGAALLFNLWGFIVLYLLLVCQAWLPFNPAGTENMRWDIAFNTAVSFMTNTNWQFYSGEGPQGVSYLTQMLGMCVQNFVSCATGLSVMAAVIRALRNKGAATGLGNFWVDMSRSTLYFLLPLAVIVTVILISQGVVQNLNAPATAAGLDGVQQVIPGGPAASQIAIKQLGTNGGGFFGNNGAHPFENATGLANMAEMLSLLLIACCCPFAYGRMIGSKRQGWTIWGAMMLIFVVMLTISFWSEYQGSPVYPDMALLEGKELRFGLVDSTLYSVATTASSNGSVNCMHASLTPLTGGVALVNMLLGEVIFGGAGCGVYAMLLFAIITVFLCGLMVGRTPEFLGKKIEGKEVRWAMVGVLASGLAVLICAGLAAATDVGRATLGATGPHAVSEILYCFGSQANNNGSAFASLGVGDTPFYSVLGGICMLIGRFAVMIPVMVIAGSMMNKKVAPPAQGTMPTDNVTFMLLLVAIVVIVGALTFFPVLSLGPIMEHLLMMGGTLL